MHRIDHVRDIHLHLNPPVHRQEQLGVQNALHLQYMHMGQAAQRVVPLCQPLLHRQDMPIEKVPQLLIPPLLDISRQRSHHIDIIMPERAQIPIDHLQIPRVLLQMLQILHLLPRLIIPPDSVQHNQDHAQSEQKIQHKRTDHQQELPVGDVQRVKKRSHREKHERAEQQSHPDQSQQPSPHFFQNTRNIPPHQPPGHKKQRTGQYKTTAAQQDNVKPIPVNVLHRQTPGQIGSQSHQIAHHTVQNITKGNGKERIQPPRPLYQQRRIHPQSHRQQRRKVKIQLQQKEPPKRKKEKKILPYRKTRAAQYQDIACQHQGIARRHHQQYHHKKLLKTVQTNPVT